MEIVPPRPERELSPRDVEELRRAAYRVTDDSILMRLQGIGALRRLLPRFEEDIVRSARKDGFSWVAIGVWMGQSHQAVHKRWRRLLHGDAYDPKSWRRRPDRR